MHCIHGDGGRKGGSKTKVMDDQFSISILYSETS